MKVSQWAEIRRLHEVERLSRRAIARRLACCAKTVARAIKLSQPPDETKRTPRGSLLDPYKPRIDALIAKYPELSAVWAQFALHTVVLDDRSSQRRGGNGELAWD